MVVNYGKEEKKGTMGDKRLIKPVGVLISSEYLPHHTYIA